MVKTCPERCACNDNEANFCKICGVQLMQLMLFPPFPSEWVQRCDSLYRSIGVAASRNQVLEDRLHGVIGEVRALTEQIKMNRESSRIEALSQLSERNRFLE